MRKRIRLSQPDWSWRKGFGDFTTEIKDVSRRLLEAKEAARVAEKTVMEKEEIIRVQGFRLHELNTRNEFLTLLSR